MKIGFYACSRTKGRNAEWPIHMVFNYDKDWPENILQRRGLCGNRFFDREATLEEVMECDSFWYAHELRYKSIEELVADERRCKIDEATIKKLVEQYESVFVGKSRKKIRGTK